MKRVLRDVVCGSVAILFSSVLLHAQAGSTAQITGIVKDSSGGVLPGADVTATQTATALKRTTVTDANGSYTLPNLPVGPYRLDVNLPGFKSYVRTGLVLHVNDAPVINVELSLGAVEETVQVQAASPLVETRNTGLGQVMGNERILALPLNGRNPVDLIALTGAAVQPDGAAGISSSRSMQGGKLISIAGGQSAGVAYLLDGATHNNPYDNANLPLPFPDALQEFKVETSALSAQNGMHSGAAVNAVTRSGTNRVHGDAFEFLRNHTFNATSPFAAKNADGTRKDDGLNRNQYGGVLGGPVHRDRLFFFAGYQGTNTRQTPADNISFIPGIFNIAELMGVLKADCERNGEAALIVVDTSAAYFLGDEELSNTQMGAYARTLRLLTTLPGGPCVLVLCHPIKHVTEPSQLLPRGGGAYLAEMDGNLTLWRLSDDVVELHHTKIRGPGFQAISFKLETIKSTKLVDKSGRPFSTVRAVAITQREEDQRLDKDEEDEDHVIAAMLAKPPSHGGSFATWAQDIGWVDPQGEPYKKKVERIISKLSGAKPKLTTKLRNKWTLTEDGKTAAREAALRFESARRTSAQASLL